MERRNPHIAKLRLKPGRRNFFGELSTPKSHAPNLSGVENKKNMLMITDLFYDSLFIQLNTYHFRIFVLLKITYNYLNVGVFRCGSGDQTSDDTDAEDNQSATPSTLRYYFVLYLNLEFVT